MDSSEAPFCSTCAAEVAAPRAVLRRLRHPVAHQTSVLPGPITSTPEHLAEMLRASRHGVQGDPAGGRLDYYRWQHYPT